MSEGLNCETVAVSPYAVFAGLPVSVWGIIGYLVMGTLALSGLVERTWPLGLLLESISKPAARPDACVIMPHNT